VGGSRDRIDRTAETHSLVFAPVEATCETIMTRDKATATQSCYAAPLNDCDGGPFTREHFVSETVLEQFGKTFLVDGTKWAPTAKRVSREGARVQGALQTTQQRVRGS
jgi:hypothetical protein